MGILSSEKIGYVGVIYLTEDYIGQTYGILKVIGDTGKRHEGDGSKILIARNTETGELVENSARYFRHGDFTGFIGSAKHRKESGERIKSSREKLSEKQEKKRAIKARITQYKKRKGYYFDKDKKKFVVRIQVGGKTRRIGTFNTEQEAIQARQKAVDEQIKKLKEEMERL